MSIIPCRPDKRPAITSWKPWQEKAPSLSQLQAWHKSLNPACWAIVCGRISGVVVLDFDGAIGLNTLRVLKLEPHVRTGGGGAHVYFLHPGKRVPTVSSKKGRTLAEKYPGLDVRGDGGYAIFHGKNASGEYQQLRELVPEPARLLQSILRQTRNGPSPCQSNSNRINGWPQHRIPVDVLLQRTMEMVAVGNGRNNSGFWFARQLRDNGYSRSVAEEALMNFVAQVPACNAKGQPEAYTVSEIQATLDQVYSHPAGEPWVSRPAIVTLPGSKGETKARSTRTVSNRDLAQLPLNDDGNAQRLVHRFGHNLKFCEGLGWFIWDGKRWKLNETRQIDRFAAETARALYQEAANAASSEHSKELAKWAISSGNARRRRDMIDQARHMVAIEPTKFDRDPLEINTLTGVLDLRTGELRPHRREDLMTKIAPVVYDPKAACPRWERFLSEIFEPCPAMIPFIQRAVGYSLTAETNEECLFLLYGTGRNGKGTLMGTILAALGDYATTADASTFIVSRHRDRPRDDIANMRGRRFIAAQESQEGSALAEDLVKWLTGGDRVRARRLYENSTEFDPTWKIWLAVNHKPRIRGTDAGIWSRIKVVPFDVSFVGREDHTLKAALRADLPGIFAWAVKGALEWRARGLQFPEPVTSATSEYRSESDSLGRFIEEESRTGESLQIQARRLYEVYKKWAEHAGERAQSETAFGRKMTEKGFKKKRSGRGNVYCGIALKKD